MKIWRGWDSKDGPNNFSILCQAARINKRSRFCSGPGKIHVPCHPRVGFLSKLDSAAESRENNQWIGSNCVCGTNQHTWPFSGHAPCLTLIIVKKPHPHTWWWSGPNSPREEFCVRQVLPKSYLGLGISDPLFWSNEISCGKNYVTSLVFNPFSHHLSYYRITYWQTV